MYVKLKNKRHNFFSIYFLVFFVGVFFFCTIANGQEPHIGTCKTVDPRALGLAGALVASPSSTTGIYLNPATIAMVNLYHMNLSYQYSGGENLHNGGLAILDSITSQSIAVGASLNYLKTNNDYTAFESWDGRLSLAAGLGDVVFIGLTGRYLRAANDLEPKSIGPNGISSLPSSDSLQVDGFTFDAGAALALGKFINIGLTGYNLTNTKSIYAPLQVGTGLSVTLFDFLMIETDLLVDFSSHQDVSEQVAIGIEGFFAKKLAVRAGYRRDLYYDLDTISGGLGYVGYKFALDVGYQHDIADFSRFRLALGLRVFIS